MNVMRKAGLAFLATVTLTLAMGGDAKAAVVRVGGVGILGAVREIVIVRGTVFRPAYYPVVRPYYPVVRPYSYSGPRIIRLR